MDDLLNVIGQAVRTVMPELESHTFLRNDSLEALGANSMDRADIVMLVLEVLRLQILRTDTLGPANLGELADLLDEKLRNR